MVSEMGGAVEGARAQGPEATQMTTSASAAAVASSSSVSPQPPTDPQHEFEQKRALAHLIWSRALEVGCYPNLVTWIKGGRSARLDLHNCSVGAAEMAIRWCNVHTVPTAGASAASAPGIPILSVLSGPMSRSRSGGSSMARSDVLGVLK